MSKMVQVRNVSDDLHRKLKIRAAKAGLSLSDYLKSELERIASLQPVSEAVSEPDTYRSKATLESITSIIRNDRLARSNTEK